MNRLRGEKVAVYWRAMDTAYWTEQSTAQLNFNRDVPVTGPRSTVKPSAGRLLLHHPLLISHLPIDPASARCRVRLRRFICFRRVAFEIKMLRLALVLVLIVTGWTCKGLSTSLFAFLELPLVIYEEQYIFLVIIIVLLVLIPQ